MLRRRRRALATALSVLASLACGGPPDPVDGLLRELVDAAEARDAESFGACLASGFRGPGGMDRAEAGATLRRYFAAYESIGIRVHGVEAERGEAVTRVRCRVEFSGKARKAIGLDGFLPPAALYRFELELADEGGVLKVTRASWEAVEPSPGPEG